MARRALTALALGALAACAAPASLTPTPTRAPPPRPPPAVAEAIDLSPVAEPPGLVLVGRLNAEFVRRLPVEGALPSIAGSPLSMLTPELEPVLRDHVARGPIELAVALGSPEAVLLRGADVVWSLPLASFQAALDALRAQPRLRVQRRGASGAEISDGEGLHCDLAASAGPAPTRLVCGTSRGALDTLGPYAARGLPTRALGVEPVVVEAWPVRFARPHREALTQAARFLAPKTGRARDAAISVLAADAVDLLADLDNVRLVGRETGGALELELAASLSGETSWASRTLSSLTPRTPGLAGLWGRLPSDTQAAWFFTGAAPSRTDEARAALVSWLAEEAGPSVSRATLDLVARTFVQRAPHLYAHGDAHGRDARRGLAGGLALWEQTRSTYGWHVFGFDEPARAYLPELDRGMRDYNAGRLRAFAYQSLPRLCEGLGKIKKKPAPRTLPAGSWVYELPMPGRFFDACVAHRTRTPSPAPSESLVVVVVPIGDSTFVGLGLGEREMVERMRGLSLAPRPELPTFEDPAVRLASAFSLGGLWGLTRFVTMREHRAGERERLRALPNGGATRALFSLSVEKTQPTRLRAKLTLPAGMLADLQATKDPSRRKRW